MKFLNPYFLAGLAAVLLPILIHLLTRDRIRKVAFSTLRFFAKTSARVLRRKRFQEAMLLALRMLILAAVAMIFARPYLASPEDAQPQANSARKARVIVADVSGSIGQSGSTDALRKAAKDALGGLDEVADAAGLIAFADAPVVESVLTTEFGGIKSKIDALAPGQGGTNIHEAIRLADGLLAQVKAKDKEIVLISDLQRSGWLGGDSKSSNFRLSGGVKLSIKTLPTPQPAVTIAELDCPESLVMDNAPRTVAAKIANPTNQEIKDLPVTLAINGKTVATQKVNLRASASGAVRFSHLFDRAGDNSGVIYIGADGAESKNPLQKAYFNVRAIPKIQVVILNGCPSTNPVLDGAFFLEKALSPEQNSAFAVKIVPAAAAKAADLADAQVVIAASVSKVDAGVQSAMGQLLQRGGGLLFLPGETVDFNAFNATFANLAPCRLRSVITAEPSKTGAAAPAGGQVVGATIAKMNLDHPIFETFLRPHCGDFATTRFFRWWEIGDSQTSSVLARFDDNRPAVLERPIGRGTSMLLASSPDLRWSNLPLRAIFLPYLHQTVRYLAIKTEKKTAFVVGQVVEVPEGLQLKGPSGNVLAAKDGKVTLTDVGLCTWSGGDGKGDYAIAVNAVGSEATVAAVTPDEIVSAMQRSESELDNAVDAAADESFKARLDRLNIWWYLAAAAAALMVVELLAANKTLRH